MISREHLELVYPSAARQATGRALERSYSSYLKPMGKAPAEAFADDT